MLLAHGTSAKNLPKILKEGILPRGQKESLWAACPSASSRVYLSNAYAFYFAHHCSKEDDDLLVLEVDVVRKNLFPDEDFLGFITDHPHNLAQNLPDLRERTMFLRDWIEEQPKNLRLDLADKSLLWMGNVSHNGPIPTTEFAAVH